MKKYFFGLAIVAVAIGAFAFTTTEKESKKAVLTSWYEYRGPVPQTTASIKEETNYEKVTAPSGCSSNQNICAIKVPGTNDTPDDFDLSLENDLVSAFNSHTPQSGYIEMKP